MRWLVLVPYAALVVLAWVSGGTALGLVVLLCVLLLTAVFRPMTAGAAIGTWARRLSRPDSTAGHGSLPAVVRAGRYLAQRWSGRRERSDAVDASMPPPSDDVIVLVADDRPAGGHPGQTPDILDSADKNPPS